MLEAPHIDLEAIALSRGATVHYRQLDGCEARLVANGERAIISVDPSSNRGRQRFSLAHELAHWVCDRERGSFACAKDDIGPQNGEEKSVEARANVFASQLVLPDYLVMPWLQGRRMVLATAGDLAHDFQASLTAAAIRLCKRAPLPACVACHGKAKRHWFVKNLHWPFELMVSRELHQDTIAFTMAFGVGSGMQSPRREPANRWLNGPGVFQMTVETQSVPLNEDAVLTFVTIVK